jgi:glycosyltransferase involved in cell wall biosynthesis
MKQFGRLEIHLAYAILFRNFSASDPRPRIPPFQKICEAMTSFSTERAGPSKSTPIVSVFIPVYNGEAYLEQTLKSLLAQSFSDFEIIIVNDGSTDGTLEIARTWASRDERVRIVSHDTNLGLSAARNTGWQEASSSSVYLMNHDSDDLSHPDKLKRQVAYLDSRGEVAAVGSFCEYIDDSGSVVGWPPIEWSPRLIRTTFGRLNSMVISATLVRKRLFATVGGFRAEFGGCDDYDFWARALLAGFELANLPEVLHKIRIHPASMGAIHSEQMERHAATIRNYYRRQAGSPLARAIAGLSLGKTLRMRSRMRRMFNALFRGETEQ